MGASCEPEEPSLAGLHVARTGTIGIERQLDHEVEVVLGVRLGHNTLTLAQLDKKLRLPAAADVERLLFFDEAELATLDVEGGSTQVIGMSPEVLGADRGAGAAVNLVSHDVSSCECAAQCAAVANTTTHHMNRAVSPYFVEMSMTIFTIK